MSKFKTCKERAEARAKEAIAAYQKGLSMTANPYPAMSEDYLWWEDAYLDQTNNKFNAAYVRFKRTLCLGHDVGFYRFTEVGRSQHKLFSELKDGLSQSFWFVLCVRGKKHFQFYSIDIRHIAHVADVEFDDLKHLSKKNILLAAKTVLNKCEKKLDKDLAEIVEGIKDMGSLPTLASYVPSDDAVCDQDIPF